MEDMIAAGVRVRAKLPASTLVEDILLWISSNPLFGNANPWSPNRWPLHQSECSATACHSGRRSFDRIRQPSCCRQSWLESGRPLACLHPHRRLVSHADSHRFSNRASRSSLFASVPSSLMLSYAWKQDQIQSILSISQIISVTSVAFQNAQFGRSEIGQVRLQLAYDFPHMRGNRQVVSKAGICITLCCCKEAIPLPGYACTYTHGVQSQHLTTGAGKIAQHTSPCHPAAG